MGVNGRVSSFAECRLARTLALMLALAALCVGVAACGSDSDEGSNSGSAAANDDSPLGKLKAKGVVRISSTDSEPAIFRTKEPKGFFPEAAAMVFKKMGIPKVETVDMDFGAQIPSLQSGRIDMGQGFYFTPERCPAVAYTDPVLYFLDAFMVQEGNPHDIGGAGLEAYQDMAKKDVKLATTAGAAEIPTAKKAGVNYEEYPDLPTALDALKAGRADVAAWDSVTFKYLENQPSFKDKVDVTEPTAPVVNGEPQPYAAGNAFAPKNADIAREFSKVSNEMWKAGEFDALAEKYSITKDSWVTTYPMDKSAEQLCAEAEGRAG